MNITTVKHIPVVGTKHNSHHLLSSVVLYTYLHCITMKCHRTISPMKYYRLELIDSMPTLSKRLSYVLYTL